MIKASIFIGDHFIVELIAHIFRNIDLSMYLSISVYLEWVLKVKFNAKSVHQRDDKYKSYAHADW